MRVDLPTALPIAPSALALLVACQQGPRLSASPEAVARRLCDSALVSLRVAPDWHDIDVGSRRTSEARYRAIGTFADGSSAPLAAAWSVDVPEVGTLGADGFFVPSGEAGGTVTLTARTGDLHATTGLRVRLLRHYPDDVAPEVVALFAPGRPRDDRTAVPRLTRPASGAWLPSHPEEIAFEWDGRGHDVFRLRFLSAAADVSVYTSDERFVLPADVWQWLALSNRGQTVRVILEAVDDLERVHGPAAPVEVGFCHPTELCNARDEDCDGTVDESCAVADAPAAPASCEALEEEPG